MSWKILFFAAPLILCSNEISTGPTISIKPFNKNQEAAQPEESYIEPSCCPPRAVLAPALPCFGCSEFTASASFLFWQAKLWGLEFASKSYVPNTANAAVQTFNQKLFVPDFAWKPGFKVNLGYNLPYDNWDLSGRWTYYHEVCTSLKKHFNSVVAPPGIGVIPLWHYPFLQILGDNIHNPLRYQNASANWKMNFNAFDLELGHYFFPNQTIPMHFKMGAKASLIHQFYHAEYANGTTVLALDPISGNPGLWQFVSSQFQVSTHQWGIGPTLGLESKWNIWRGLNLIGNGGFSVLCSFFDLKTKYHDVIVLGTNPPNSQMRMKEKFRELTPVCEAMLGLDWGTCFWDQIFFNIAIGYEWQYWWSINHARRHYVQTLPGETFDMRGELQMQGLNATVKFDF